MSLPDHILQQLHKGHSVAAEIDAAEPEMRAFVMVIPRVPDPFKHPDLWLPENWPKTRKGIPVLRNPDAINGFEIRYIKHHRKFTETEWGWDYDHVLDDKRTRVKRLFITNEAEIPDALVIWLNDLTKLQSIDHFDSSLVTSPITGFLDPPHHFPHLWLD